MFPQDCHLPEKEVEKGGNYPVSIKERRAGNCYS
jgi:hypothetical protein